MKHAPRLMSPPTEVFRLLLLPLLPLMLMLIPAGLAAERKAEATRPAAVIDFEADVIEGERQNPNLFLQFGAQQTTLEGVVLRRKHFNDFHAVDKQWRPFDYAPEQVNQRKKNAGGVR